MPYERLTNKALSNLSTSIKNRMGQQGMVNTGGAAESLEIKGNQLLGNDYIYYLDQGRGPGRFPPIQNMRDWVRTKLNIETLQIDSVAFLVGRKISREGTAIFNDKSKGLQLDSLIDDMFEGLLKELPDEVAVEALKLLEV